MNRFSVFKRQSSGTGWLQIVRKTLLPIYISMTVAVLTFCLQIIEFMTWFYQQKKFTVFTNAERKIPYTKTIWGVARCNNNVSYLRLSVLAINLCRLDVLSHWYWRDHSIKLKSIKINITFLRATNKLCTVLEFISLSLTVSEVNISISSQNFFSSGWKWTGLRNPRLDW